MGEGEGMAIIKTHNLKVVSSNLAPATKFLNKIKEIMRHRKR